MSTVLNQRGAKADLNRLLQLRSRLQGLEAAVRACGELGIAVLPRGAGTSMCGQAVNETVCIDLSKYLNCAGPRLATNGRLP
ncbi:MAG: FAD-binding protein [Bordetella sp.]|uniref:FAD-binding protein n=1 Tax=Bordetella sp. TaxID=28081 RepID=UPI003F7C1242